MNNDTPENISDILASLKAKSELGKNLEEAQVWEHWESIMPAPYHVRSYPLRVRDKVLFIEVINAVWMHKISYKKPEILGNLQRVIAAETIENIRFSLSGEEKPKRRKKKS